MITTLNLNFSFKKHHILNNVCLKVPEGATYGYLGQNGAGKTTSIRVLLGLLHPSSGKIYYNNKEFHEYRQEILSQVGSLIGSPAFYPDLTAEENLKGIDCIYKKGRGRINEVLNLIGLAHDKNKKVKHFSTGMKQRLGIGMAMFHDPKMLVLDEPLNGLDPEGIFEVRNLINDLHRKGKTVFLSSHILSELEKVCSHIGILHQGDLVYQGNLIELVNNIDRQIMVKCRNASVVHESLQKTDLESIIESNAAVSVSLPRDKSFNYLLSQLIASGTDIYAVQDSESSLESVFLKMLSK